MDEYTGKERAKSNESCSSSKDSERGIRSAYKNPPESSTKVKRMSRNDTLWAHGKTRTAYPIFYALAKVFQSNSLVPACRWQ